MNCETMLFVICLYLTAVNGCVPTETTGCLNGQSYDLAEQFPCRNDLYYYDQTGCCAQGIPFDINNQFCCYDGVHNKDDSTCEPWDPNTPGPLATAPEVTKNKLTIPCTHGTSEYGCLNGVRYDWSVEYPCYNYLANFSTQGCCVGKTYYFSSQSCCFDEQTGEYSVFEGGHECYAAAN
uniref:Uncharacterized protein n=1 Tax=Vannella robusta TaxID=1487602 RepID=A0A7S4MIE3_9EUKA|mmetsp:Transcript_23373/g.29794  ORF Transcript_23373/g.29794 Transcript_23373/m.29794 type:complete len:179 (+) Transcript_23373:69-605(+)